MLIRYSALLSYPGVGFPTLILRLFFAVYNRKSSWPAVGQWARASLDFQLFNFSGHFRAAQTLNIRLHIHLLINVS